MGIIYLMGAIYKQKDIDAIKKQIHRYIRDVMRDDKLLPSTIEARTIVMKKIKKDYPKIPTPDITIQYNEALNESIGAMNTALLMDVVLTESYADHQSLAEDLDSAEDIEDLAKRVAVKTTIIGTRNNIRKNFADIVAKQEKNLLDIEKNEILRQKIQSDKEQGIITAAMNIEGTLEEKAAKFKQILGKNLPVIEAVLEKDSKLTAKPEEKTNG